MKNLTYEELIKIAPKDRPFQIEVENNPREEGGRQVLWARIDDDGDLSTYWYEQNNIDGIDYAWSKGWEDYKGKFTLIDPRCQKPEVLKVGQKVRVMESARDCGNLSGADPTPDDEDYAQYIDTIGREATILRVWDDGTGIHYLMESGYFYPHYAVMPVEEEEIQEIPGLEGTIDQLSTLIEKAQEIVDKHKNMALQEKRPQGKK